MTTKSPQANTTPRLFYENGNTWKDREESRPVEAVRPTAPYQRGSASSREGANHIATKARSIRAWVVWLLGQAGPVRNGGRTGGHTIEELADLVSRHSGKQVKDSTICGRVSGRKPELEGVVRKSGFTRATRSDVQADVYELVKEDGRR